MFGIIVLQKCPPLIYPPHPGTVGVGTEPAYIISTDERKDCFLTYFCCCLSFSCLFAPSFLHVFNTFSLCHSILLHIILFLNLFDLFSLYIWITWLVTDICFQQHL